jgi:hypothetical protein
MLRAEVLEDTHHIGRSNPLTTYQKYFKSAWLKLAQQPISSRVYLTNVDKWTCNCGHQKYQHHHICKHLVQAVPTPPIKFWGAIVRRRTIPLYQHPALTLKNEDSIPSYERAYVDPDDGSITDGDAHIWVGNPDILKGGGGWRDFDLEKQQGKRTHADLLEGDSELLVVGSLSVSPVLEGPPMAVVRYGDNDDEGVEQVSFRPLTCPYNLHYH